MISFTILDETTQFDEENSPVSRTVKLLLTDETDYYEFPVGGLPIEGDLTAIIEAKKGDYFVMAEEKEALSPGKYIAKNETKAQGGAAAWFLDNPAAKNLFTLSVDDLDTEVTNLVDVSFPSLTTGQRQKWRLLLMGLALAVRVLAHRLGLLG